MKCTGELGFDTESEKFLLGENFAIRSRTNFRYFTKLKAVSFVSLFSEPVKILCQTSVENLFFGMNFFQTGETDDLDVSPLQQYYLRISHLVHETLTVFQHLTQYFLRAHS
jgi:hypothetical protein